MLRGKAQEFKEVTPAYGKAEEFGFPGSELPFALGENPTGIQFYRKKMSFYLPYTLLQSMRLGDDKLSLLFAPVEIVITGEGLHHLYQLLAHQKVSRVIEQGGQFEESGNIPVHIQKIDEIPREE